MKNTFHRYMPFVFGGALGWLLVNPPAWMADLGPLAWLVNGALCALVLLSAVPLIVLANLPADLKVESLSESAVAPEMRAMEARLARMGFHRAGEPMLVHIAPSAHMIGYAHESEPVYAAVYRTTTVPAKSGLDFVSVLHGDQAGLTTNNDPAGAALPGGPGGLRQVLPGADPETMFRTHLDGLAYLKERGLAVRALSGSTFRQDFLNAMRRQREVFTSSPIRSSLVTFWRAASKQVPCVGPLRRQSFARDQIARLLGRAA